MPVKDEEKIIENKLRELELYVINKLDTYEVIFIENGSKDKTQEIIKRIIEKDNKIRLFTLLKPSSIMSE